MSISAELEYRYTYEVDVDWFEVLAISHPAWLQVYYIHNAPEQKQLSGFMDGGVRTFDPIQFKLSLPTRDSGGRSDMTIVIGVIGNSIAELLDIALTQPDERIRLRYTSYLYTDTAPLYDPPIEFNITDIDSDEEALSCVARLGDTINRPFPNGRYTVRSFPGLARR